MKLIQNFHNHSLHSCDSACAEITDIIAEMNMHGVQEFGLTDHLHTALNLPDIVSARRDFLSSEPPANFHFGVEVSVVDQKECERIAARDWPPQDDDPVYGFRDMKDYTGRFAIDLREENIRDLGIEYVVGGIHWPLCCFDGKAKMIEHYLALHLYLVEHPLVDILAHPWDSLERAAGGWFERRDKEHIDYGIFPCIPGEYNECLAESLVKQAKPAEINLEVLCNADETNRHWYLEMFAGWKRRGVRFTMGYDLHDAHFSDEKISRFEMWLTEYGFEDKDFVLPHFRCRHPAQAKA